MRFRVKYEPFITPKDGDIFCKTFFTIYTRVRNEVRMFERVTVEYEWVQSRVLDKFGSVRTVIRPVPIHFIDKED